jgi:vacuolar-type H+-ATPase subunit I/STV1
MSAPAAQGHDGRAFRLRRRPQKVALTTHILSSVGWFGIAIAVAFCAIAAAVSDDDALSRALYRTLETLPWLSIPAGITAVGTGSLLGLGTTYGLVRYWWVIAKIIIAVAVVVTDVLIVVAVAHDAAVSGQAQPPLYGSTIAHVVVLAVATVLSVFKPWGRTPWVSRDRRADAG